MVPRGLTGIESAWTSVQTIKKPLIGDYFLIISPGVAESLDDRNIKYILSQGDGSDGINKSIIDKIGELCKETSISNYSIYLLQVENSPYGEVEKELLSPATGQNKSSDTLFKDMPTYSNKGKTSGRQFKSPVINWKMLIPVFIILAGIAGAFYYKYKVSSPEYRFSRLEEKANMLLAEKKDADAVPVLEEALKIEGLDSEAIRSRTEKKLTQTKERIALEIADELKKGGNRLDAREAYHKGFRH